MRLITHSVAAFSALALAPLLAGAYCLRPSFRAGAGARLGRGPFRHEDPTSRVWLHASSVGEAKVACRLADALEASGHALRATTMTQTGLELFERDRPGLRSSYAPLDHPWCVEPVVRRGNPKLSVLIETELWPSWVGACARHDVPVVVASGRLSDRSFPRYRKARSLIRGTLGRIDAVGARTDLDAERFVELGVPEARVRVTGDLKLDPPEEQPALAIDLIRALADVPAVVGGSTHQGEEAALLDALQAAEKAGHGFVLVLAPRRIERAEELVRLCQSKQRRVYRRTQLEGRHLVPGEVLILDSFGELAAMYATASIAFVGGTLANVGGHNVVEPLHTGCPVLYGPRTENVRKVVEIIEVGGAGTRVETPEALAQAVVTTFDDLEASRQRGELGRERLAEHRGSVARTVDLIEETLERRGKTLPVGSGAGPGPGPGARAMGGAGDGPGSASQGDESASADADHETSPEADA
ncbi:MAG: 3-deoxy-D-manno-octulosonic acid transferase [Myxococcota bacterium]